MPLIKRLIEPTELSRGKLGSQQLASELEAVSVNTLCGIIRQLSSLSKHAEDVFGELFSEAHNISKRSNSLQERIQKLSIKVTQLDSAGEQSKLSFFLIKFLILDLMLNFNATVIDIMF